MIKLIKGDCMDLMKATPDKFYELSIVDPPYAINVNFNMGLHKGQKKRHVIKKWDNNLPPPFILLNYSELAKIKLYGEVITLNFQRINILYFGINYILKA